MQHRARQHDRARRAELRHPRDFRAARITEPEQFGGFVERFAGGVVECLA